MKELNELDLPNNLRYSENHTWALLDGEKVRVGISDYAQDQLGDVVYVDLPQVGDSFEKGKEFAFAPGKTQKAPMSRYQFRENPDFMTYVEKLANPSDKIIVYCGSSKRSAMAADDLVKAGYENVYNMLKGFSGGYVKEDLPSKKMFTEQTIDPKFIYPPDVSN